MASRFVVMENPNTSKGERYRFVRDGFSILGFVFPVFWLLAYRVWFAALIVVGVTIALNILGTLPTWAVMASFALLGLSILVALEGGSWRVESLQRKGFVPVDVIEARSLEEAELRFVARLENTEPVPEQSVASAKTALQQKPVETGDMIFAHAGQET